MLVSFHSLALDFYAWSEERYVRFMTATLDLSLPVNLMTDAAGLVPTIGTATAANTVISNSQLLSGSTAGIGSVLGPLLGTAIGMFAGNVPAIAVPSIPLPSTGGTSAGNIQIQIPQSGIQGLSEGTSRYIALFANLQYVSNTRTHVSAGIARNEHDVPSVPAYDPHVYEFGPDFAVEQLPHIVLHLDAPNSADHDVEYTYRADGMTWCTMDAIERDHGERSVVHRPRRAPH